MTAATLVRPDARSHDLVTIPRAGLEEAWGDQHAGLFEARQANAKVYLELKRAGLPLARVFEVDRRLARLDEYARRHAAEAAGITYISANQLPLFDGCGPNGRSA